ncbi:hypothetical protein MTR_3g079380 [Medicago truncatula]|uniref:Uncharacterized protein n=1 Tax=Medicago truncatula TaxID=3880 RepID=G7J626_MEDTR|nr:hypothetical protein MTR_3g079380 [Medicago truncatula]
MGGGLVGDNIGLNEEVIKKACSLSFKAHNSTNEPYITKVFRTTSNLTISRYKLSCKLQVSSCLGAATQPPCGSGICCGLVFLDFRAQMVERSLSMREV